MSKNSLKGAISSKQSTETQVWWGKKTMPSCKFSLGPIHWYGDGSLNISKPLIVHLVGDPKISNLLIPIDSSIYIYIYVFHFRYFLTCFFSIFWDASSRCTSFRPGARAGRDGREPEEPVECGIVVLLGDLGHVSLWQMVILTVWLFNLAMEHHHIG